MWFRSGRKPDELINEIAEAATRTVGLAPFPTQLRAAAALQGPVVVELDTGQGKTLTGAIAATRHAIDGARVWISTANDYLAARDAESMRPLYAAFGLNVGSVTAGLSQRARSVQYDCHIVYGTLREFGFDYLRARMAERSQADATSIRPALLDREPFRSVLLVDEADSLLIDEAGTPLIVSRPGSAGPAEQACFRWAAALAPLLREGQEYRPLGQGGLTELTDEGRIHVLSHATADELRPLSQNDLLGAVERALLVNRRYQRDRDYLVVGDQVQIVDEFTGRTSEGRTWSEGVHQAIEAREGLPLTHQNRSAARITIQDFVARFHKVSGMTGTAAEAASEFRMVYGLKVLAIPPHQPSRRIRQSSVLTADLNEKDAAIAKETQEAISRGQAVLIGTPMVEDSERLSVALGERGLKHRVLSARIPDHEAEVIAEAGRAGAITVATNMAGRGTDIRIDDSVRSAGGLYVIGTEFHTSGRIDRQLAGRCGRQGDPGVARWFLSKEDRLLSEADRDLDLDPAGPVTEHTFRKAQKRLESRHFQNRVAMRLSTARIAQSYRLIGLDPVVDPLD